jgi:hypothetical protein
MAKGMSKTGLSKEHMIEALVAQNLGIECVVKKPLLQLEEEEELLEEVATEGAEDSEWSDEEGDADVTSVNGLLWFAGLELTLSMLSQDPELKAHQVRYSVLQAKAETGLVSQRMVGCSGLLEETQRLLVNQTKRDAFNDRLQDTKSVLRLGWELAGVKPQCYDACTLLFDMMAGVEVHHKTMSKLERTIGRSKKGMYPVCSVLRALCSVTTV